MWIGLIIVFVIAVACSVWAGKNLPGTGPG